jgi:4-nitrophenyl phosphatase
MSKKEDTLRYLRHLIIDMDGVLYRGQEAIPGTPQFLEFLRQQAIGFVLATNNSTRTPQQYVDKLAGMGVQVHPREVLTSAQATASYLAGIAPPGTRVFVIGQDGLWTALREAGFALVEDGPEYVVAGMDFRICYERLAQATLHIRTRPFPPSGGSCLARDRYWPFWRRPPVWHLSSSASQRRQ